MKKWELKESKSIRKREGYRRSGHRHISAKLYGGSWETSRTGRYGRVEGHAVQARPGGCCEDLREQVTYECDFWTVSVTVYE